jgi:hypothetical protein
MIDPRLSAWRDDILLTRDLDTAGARTEFFSRVRRGDFVQLFRGVYVRVEAWRASDRHEQYRWRVRAAATFANGNAVFSHESAAAMWRLPSLGRWPATTHTVEEVARGGRNTSVFTRHTVGIPHDVEVIDGIQVTSLARTVVDLSRSRTFGAAVTVADAALRRSQHPLAGVPLTTLTHDDLWGQLEQLPLRHGAAKASKAISFASGLADRPGESISRVNMHLGGIAPPQLQVKICGVSGKEYTVDFWWELFNKIGEFDGRDKYSNPEFLRGRSPEQALMDEKYREDDLRGTGRGMTRWGWDVAKSVPLLRAHLLAAGVR